MRFAAGLSAFVTSCGQKLWQWINYLLPGETHARTAQFPFKNPDSKNFQLLLQHKDKLYVYGKVNYEDIRDTSKHFSHFCYFWTGEQQPPVFLNCGEYNDAD